MAAPCEKTKPETKSKKLPLYQDINGYRLSLCYLPDLVQSAMDYTPTPKDIVVATYPKCGTTWMIQIVLLIVRKGELPTTVTEYFATCPFIEMLGAEEIANIPDGKGCLKTHMPFNMIPYSPEAKYIYVARNPRDCCISFYHHTKFFPGYYFTEGSFDDFFDIFVEGKVDFNDYFDNLLSWYDHRNDPNVFFTTFEEMKADHPGIVKKVAEFLGEEALAGNDEFLDEIVHKSSFQYMKNNTNNLFQGMLDMCENYSTDPNLPRGFRAWAESNADAIKKGEVSMGDFVRYGKVRKKTLLSPEQEERLKLRILEKTKGSDVMQLWSDFKWGAETS